MKAFRLLGFLLLMLSLGIWGCGDDEGGGAPAQQPGTGVINASGGSGTTSGGAGGGVNIDVYGDVKLSKYGSVDTSFSLPGYSLPSANLGSNPLTISADTTIEVVSTTDPDPAAGTPYMVAGVGTSYIYISNGNGMAGDETPVTGLKVNEGVTLTLGLNKNYGGNNGLDYTYLNFDNDVEILGTVLTNAVSTGDLGGTLTIDFRHGSPATDRDKGGLYIRAYRIITGSSSLIDTSGADATTTDDRGGDGGFIWLDNNDNGGVFLSGEIKANGGNGLGTGIGGNAAVITDVIIGGVSAYSYGILINNASISANGGNGSAGGSAGYVQLYANANIFNKGTLTSNGGNGSAGNGGNSSSVSLSSNDGSVFNSGNLTANGGNGGGTGAGGNGGYIRLYAGYSGYTGQIRNSGNLTANGGSSGTTGAGGSGGYIDFYTYGGDIRTSGKITADGGSGTGGNGGSGGNLNIYADYGYDYGYGEEVASGLIQVSGDISLNGGSSTTTAGGGGDINVDQNYDGVNYPPVKNIEFLGYANLILNGGDGGSGGNGGDVNIYTQDAWFGSYSDAYPVGSITNELPIALKGGTGETTTGGGGGDVDWEAEGEAYAGTTVVKNSGSIDVSGGSAKTSGGSGGDIYLYGHDGLNNSGALTANGGDGETSGGNDTWSYIELYASLNITNTGTITANGGSGTGTNANGGDGAGQIAIYAGGITTNSGSIYAKGGDATGAGIPGDGGYVKLFSGSGSTVNSAAIITVAKGTVGTGGSPKNGIILFDLTDVTPTDGTLP